MLKTVLTVAVLTLAPVVSLSAAYAHGIAGTGGQTGRPYPGDTGLPAHHGEGDQKPPKPQPTPQDVVIGSPHLPPIIHGPFPGPFPGSRPGQPDPHRQ